jgi:hypothetical protein
MAVWRGADFPGETGMKVVQGCVAFSVFEVPSVPDFSSSRFPHLAQLDEAQRIRLLGERQNRFLATLQALGPYHAVSLRYYCSPTAEGEPRIRVFLVGRSYGESDVASIENRRRLCDTIERNFPAEYYRISKLDSVPDSEVLRHVVDLDGVTSIVEVLKMERMISAWHKGLCGFSFYYLPGSFNAADNSMLEFCRALTSVASAKAVMADICLLPTLPLSDIERGEAKNWAVVCERWGREQRLEVPGGLYSDPIKIEVAPDPHAKDAERAYQEVIKRYGSGERVFLYAFRVLSWDRSPPHNIASSLVACALLPGSEHRIRSVTQADPIFQKALNAARFCYVTPSVCYDKLWSDPEAPETIRRVHRLVDIDEAGGFFRLPIPGRNGCRGIPLDTGLGQQSASRALTRTLDIGRVIDGARITSEQVGIPIKDLTKSALIVGMPGAGKTTLCYSLLTQLWEQPDKDRRIPFIVIEPAKTEYRALLELPCFRDDLWVFSVGKERVSPFRFNPFDVPKGVDVSEHISALKTCFEGAFSLWDPLPMILETAIGDIYAARGWSEYGVSGEGPSLEPPTMADLYIRAMAVAKRTSYKGETAGNIRGALEARLGSLLRGPKGRCLNTRRSIPVDMLMRRPVVLELDGLNGDEKALMMMFLLTLVREYAKATRKSGAPLTHVLLVEEAHNVIGRADAAGGGDSRANPKEVATRFFTDMLAEMRALGEGIVIADQLPSAIAPQAIKNTNIKVMHRLVAADDREELGRAMVLDTGQTEQAAMLPAGQSFVHMEGWARSRLVVEVNFKAERGLEEPPDDSVVTDFMASAKARGALHEIFLPYVGCKETCQVCSPRIREENERRVQRVLSSLMQDLESAPKDKWLSVATEAFLQQVEVPGDQETADAEGEARVRGNCSSIHLAEQIRRRLKDEAT